MENRFTEIICGFPGIGKTECAKKYQDPYYDYKVLDLDFSLYIKNFNTYINKIIDNIGRQDIIFISFHEKIRQKLYTDQRFLDKYKNGEFRFTFAYPNVDQKENYINRYRERGSSETFIKLISDNWDLWLYSLNTDRFSGSRFLLSNSFISSFITSKIEKYRNIVKRRKDFQNLSKEERDKYCSLCSCTGGCDLCDKYKEEENFIKSYKTIDRGYIISDDCLPKLTCYE